MRKPRSFYLALCGLLATATAVPAQAPDVTVVLEDIGETAWYVDSVSPPEAGVVTATGTGNPNPTLSLLIGTRYNFVSDHGGFHPFAILAQGPPNDVLLRQAPGTGTFESDPDVNWDNSTASDMIFTLTPQLADALQADGKTPTYMCEAHPSMIGTITFQQQPSPFEWPSGVETFENATLGSDVVDAFADWVIVGASADYTAVISEDPDGAPGQAGGSTRWLTVTDADAPGENRLYPPTIEATEPVASYKFEWVMNIEDIDGGPILLISQHFNGGFANMGGIELTLTGVNVIILGSDDGGVGKDGATVREELYSYTDSGGFGTGDWVTISYEVDFQAGEIRGNATGSDGSTEVDVIASGLDLQGGADAGTFRWCMRNNSAGSVSTISYDNLAFEGVGEGVTSVPGWHLY